MRCAPYGSDLSSWKNEVGKTHCAVVQPCFHIGFYVPPVGQLPVRGNCCSEGEERAHSSSLLMIMSSGILSAEMRILKEGACWLTS